MRARILVAVLLVTSFASVKTDPPPETPRQVVLTDISRLTAGDPDPRMSSVYRWRPAFQADFAARLDWCVKPHGEANHPPVVRIAGDRERPATVGDVVTLDAGGSTDPDGDGLVFSWSVYPTNPDLSRRVVFGGQDRGSPQFVVGPELAGRTIPILLSVTDRGEPALTRYGRVLLRVAGAE